MFPPLPSASRSLLLAALTALALSAHLVAPGRAQACGGCFAPSGAPSPVVAHRMAVLMNDQETILWDQFEYSGDPNDFVWVLPVLGAEDVTVELSTDDFFQELEYLGTPTLQGPWISTGGGGGRDFGGFGCGGGADSAAFADAPRAEVVVHRMDTVGPYETAVIGSEDPDAIVTWLRDNGYAIGDDLIPIVARYAAEGSNFLALRMSPQRNQKRIQPIRVRCPVASDRLPLEMVAAGVSGSVGLDLYVLANERYEASNYPTVDFPRERLYYDQTTATYNYDALAEETLDLFGGEVWMTEVAYPLDWAREPYVYDENGQRYEAPAEWSLIGEALGYDSVYLTRLRADLPAWALDRDLYLEPAPSTAGNLYREIYVESLEPIPMQLPPPTALFVLMAGVVGLLRRRK